jgi:hypothetical protein
MRLSDRRRVHVYVILTAISVLTALVPAQVPNVTVRVQWAPNPAIEAVTSYTLVVDGGLPLVVLPAACAPTVCEQAVTVTFASHTFSLVATNQWATSPAAVVTENLSVPGIPSSVRIVR